MMLMKATTETQMKHFTETLTVHRSSGYTPKKLIIYVARSGQVVLFL